jgi:hypothetical protein
MTMRLLFVIVNDLLSYGLIMWSLVDSKRRQTLVAYAIWFQLMSIGLTLGAIAIHVGAYPLWNNK